MEIGITSQTHMQGCLLFSACCRDMCERHNNSNNFASCVGIFNYFRMKPENYEKLGDLLCVRMGEVPQTNIAIVGTRRERGGEERFSEKESLHFMR
jgi:hypothetical protein